MYFSRVATPGAKMVIVTGGAGFIGSVLIHELNLRGQENIIVVDDFEDGDKWFNLRGLKYSKVINIGEFYSMENWGEFRNVEAIFHMGACSSTTERDMDYLYENNFLCSRQLCNFAIDNNISFLYASSAATYGDGEDGYDDDHEQLGSLRPLNKYGYSKQLFDQWILSRQNVPSTCLGFKFFNVFGPNEYHKEKMVSVVYQAFHQINETGKVRLFKSHKEGYADGEQKRDFIYVKDVVKAMLELAEISKGKIDYNGIYNLGTGTARTFKDLAIATFKAMSKEPEIEFFNMPDSIRNQYQYYTEANMKKFYAVLPDFKFSTLEEAVADYVQSYLAQKNPYLDLNKNEV